MIITDEEMLEPILSAISNADLKQHVSNSPKIGDDYTVKDTSSCN